MIWFLTIGILLIIVEILTPTVFMFFAFGISFLLNSFIYYFSNNLALSLVTTGFTTFIVFYFIKKSDLFKPQKEFKSNISNYVGKSCIVEDVLDNNTYRIKIFSEVWTAKSSDILQKGDSCKVINIQGNTLNIEKNT